MNEPTKLWELTQRRIQARLAIEAAWPAAGVSTPLPGLKLRDIAPPEVVPILDKMAAVGAVITDGAKETDRG